MRENLVAVGEVDRRVLVVGIDTELGLITCVWSRIGNTARHSSPSSRDAGGLLVPARGVDEAESRGRPSNRGSNHGKMTNNKHT